MTDKEPSELQREIQQFHNDIQEIERGLMNSIFADPDFDPEMWLREKNL